MQVQVTITAFSKHRFCFFEITFICVCVWVGQRTTCEGGFSINIVCIPGSNQITKPHSKHHYPLNHLASPPKELLIPCYTARWSQQKCFEIRCGGIVKYLKCLWTEHLKTIHVLPWACYLSLKKKNPQWTNVLQGVELPLSISMCSNCALSRFSDLNSGVVKIKLVLGAD